MAQFEQHFVQDLTQQIKVRHCGSIVFNADNESNVVSVRLFNGSEPVAISGSVVGAVVCSDGSTVPLTGSYSGNTASITLTGDCFAVLGQIGVGIQIVNGTQKTTVLKVIYNVETLTTENVVDPGSRITLEVGDLIAAIDEAVATIPEDYSALTSEVADIKSVNKIFNRDVVGVPNPIDTATWIDNANLNDSGAVKAAQGWKVTQGYIETSADSYKISYNNSETSYIVQVAGYTSSGSFVRMFANADSSSGVRSFTIDTTSVDKIRIATRYGNPILSVYPNDGKIVEKLASVEDGVSELKSAFYGLQIDNLPITILKNKYVTNDATIADYTGWDCTDYIPVKGYKTLKVKSSVQSGYNLFVDASKVKVGNNFTVKTSYSTVNVPSGAVYVLMSNTAAGMENLEASFEKYPVMDGKHPETETALSQLVNMGVYNIEKSKLSTFEDRPSDVDDAVATLINYSGAYASGAYTIQRLYQLSGKAWERIIYSPTGETTANWKRIDLDADASNILKGKKLVTAGDSYTQAYWDGDYAEYNGKNYGYYIAQRNNMTFVNSGISGSTMAVPPGGAGNKNPFVIDRYAAVPADTDYLTIWFGINDAANCDLGSITDGDDGTPVNNTIYGAWNIVLKYYLTNRPWMKVLIIVPSMPSSESANNVRNAIRAVAKKWGYPYLDWQMDYSIPAFFDKREGMSDEAVSLRRAAFGYNGPNTGHPNPQWYQYESTIIEAKLRSI